VGHVDEPKRVQSKTQRSGAESGRLRLSGHLKEQISGERLVRQSQGTLHSCERMAGCCGDAL